MSLAIEFVKELEIEPVFQEIRVIRRKRHFDENFNHKITQSVEESYLQLIKLFPQLSNGLNSFIYMKNFLVFYLVSKN